MSTKLFFGIIAVLLILAGGARSDTTPATQPKSHSGTKYELGQTEQSLDTRIARKAAKVRYLLFLPADYGKDPKRKWPVMMFLHGAGERGSDIEQVKRNGPPSFVDTQPDFPFIVVSPQCDGDKSWDMYIPALNQVLDHVLATTQSDSNRLYLTGLSMGGIATWDWAIKQPTKFAAIVPICGEADPKKARVLKNLPIWAFHGEADHEVSYDADVKMIDALKKIGAPNLQFTHYPGVGHDSWTKAYETPELYEWLLDQDRRPGKHHATTAPATKPTE